MGDALDAVLAEAQQRGLLGAASTTSHRRHAEGFLRPSQPRSGRVVDLGAGGGVPGLVLAWQYPDLEVDLVDRRGRAVEWLATAVSRLDLDSRVRVVHASAEALGRDPQWREQCSSVVARGFARPAVVCECASPLLVMGAVLVVSEPPAVEPVRWPAADLGALGLAVDANWSTEVGHYQALRKVGASPDRYPRRPGIPGKRPLW